MQRLVSHEACAPALMSLVRTIHAAAVDAAEWPGVLDRVRTLLGARIVTLGHHEFSTGADRALYESPGSARFADEVAGFAAMNPWFMSSADYIAGRVMTGDELISAAELRRTDFYRGVLQPRGLLHRLCGVVARRPGSVDFLSALRHEDEQAFGEREKEELEIVLAHVTLSLQSQWRWQEAQDLSQALVAMADHDANPVLLVTEDATPIYRNPAAEALLERAVGLRLEDGRVVAATPGDRRLLQQLIGQAARAGAAGARVVSLACAPSPPVIAQVRPAGHVFLRHAGERRGVALIAVRGGQALHDPASCLFARMYEFTPAQARVSALVFAGKPLAAIARSLGVSENTVRSHLKQIFLKTETHGQMELVHLHAKVCPVLT